MELRQLAVVVAVAEEGGFTAAAHRLRTVQSTVSTVVRALERDLGAPLFHRTTHRVELTPAGEAFLPAARAALEEAARARAAVSPVRGQVRLGVCPGLLADWHRVLATLRHVHPGLTVEVRQVAARTGPDAVVESTVDAVLTVVADRPPEPAPNGSAHASAVATRDLEPGLAVTLLACEELVLATAPGGSPSAPADLSELSLVDFPVGWAIREAVDRAFPRRRLSLEVDDLAVAAGLLRAGLAACVLPGSAAARFPELTVRRFDRPPAWQLGVVHRCDVSPAVAALLAQLG